MGRIYNPDDFVIQYPGVYHGAAKEAMDKYFAMIHEINSTEVTGADVAAGNIPAVKLGATLPLSGNFIRYCTEKYAPEYALMLDSEVAKAHGYEDIFAMIGLSSCDDVFTLPTPPEARDTLLVSQINHRVESIRPVYPGDTLYMIRDKSIITDLTPTGGSIYRHLHQQDFGTVYNQKGEVVNKVCYTTMESLKVYKDGRLPKPKSEFGFADMWEDPDWFARPFRPYTDEDYALMREIARNEVVRGDEPLYWEDVVVGTEIPDGMFGPIYDGVCPTKPYGQGVGGCRKLKKEFVSDELFAKMVRDEATGIYTTGDRAYDVPEAPDGIKPFFLAPPDEDPGESAGGVSTADIHKTSNDRSALINFMGRDIALGHILDYVGYHGYVRSCEWTIMVPDVHAALGKPVPNAPNFRNVARRVPGMEASTIPIHGLTTDVARTKARITDKYVREDKFLIEVTFWNVDIEDRIWITGAVEVELPSNRK